MVGEKYKNQNSKMSNNATSPALHLSKHHCKNYHSGCIFTCASICAQEAKQSTRKKSQLLLKCDMILFRL